MSAVISHIEDKFAQNVNTTNYSEEELVTLESNCGLSDIITDETSAYQGNTTDIVGSSILNTFNLIPGLSAGLTGHRANEVREERSNTGTFNSQVRNTLPKFSEKDAWLSDLGTSIKETVKAPFRLTLKILTKTYDGLSGRGNERKQWVSQALCCFDSNYQPLET